MRGKSVTFKRLRRQAIVFAAAAATVVGIVAPAQATTTPVGDGHFHVSGTKIIGPDGKTFVARGVNIGGLERYSSVVDLTYNTLSLAHDWGANFIRLPLSSTFWDPEMCTYDPNYASTIDQVVSWAESLKMLIL